MAAQTLIDRRTAEIEAQVGSGEPAEGMYLTYLLSSDKLTRAEVYISVTELLLGGVDTVRSGVTVRVQTGGLLSGFCAHSQQNTTYNMKQQAFNWFGRLLRVYVSSIFHNASF